MGTPSRFGSLSSAGPRLALAVALAALGGCHSNRSHGDGGTPIGCDGGMCTENDGSGAFDGSMPTSCDGGSCSNLDGGDAGVDAGPICNMVDGGTFGSFALGTPCNSDADCKSGICLTTGVCSEGCLTNADCPNSSWQCLSDKAQNGACVRQVCYCKITNGGNDVCDGKDNDCNGIVDDPATAVCQGLLKCISGNCQCPADCDGGDCGSTLIKLCPVPGDSSNGVCIDVNSDPNNCGACNKPCGAGEVCEGGQCVCSGTECPDVAAGTTACVDTTTDEANCGGCGNAVSCTQDCINGTPGAIDREWVRWQIPSSRAFTSLGSEIDDSATGLSWYGDANTSVPSTQAAAESYCASLSTTDGGAGKTWRLPTLIELLSIVDYGQANNAGLYVSADFPIQAPGTDLWASTALATDSTQGWTVDFSSGADVAYPASTKLAFLCVAQTISQGVYPQCR